MISDICDGIWFKFFMRSTIYTTYHMWKYLWRGKMRQILSLFDQCGWACFACAYREAYARLSTCEEVKPLLKNRIRTFQSTINNVMTIVFCFNKAEMWIDVPYYHYRYHYFRPCTYIYIYMFLCHLLNRMPLKGLMATVSELRKVTRKN